MFCMLDIPLPTSCEVEKVEQSYYEEYQEYENYIEVVENEEHNNNEEKKRKEKKVKPLDKITITSGYTGPKKTRTYKINGKMVTDHHYGVDLVGGSKIYAVADGKVVKVVNKGEKGGTMCLVRIKHKDYQSAYYHCKSGSIKVKVGQYVKKHQHIADVGNTGKVTASHLHFQIDKGSNATSINPTAYAKGNKELVGLTKPAKDWATGDYKTIKEKYARKTPEVTSGNKIKYNALEKDIREKCYQDKLGYAKYKLNQTVPLSQFATDKKGYIWGKCKNNWLCVYDNTGNQVEKV